MARTSTALLVLLALGLSAHPTRAGGAGTTPLIRTYQGSSFFDRWEYFGNYDNTTEGDAFFANQSVATSSSVPLTYTTSSNTSVIRVDNTSTVAYNDKRNTIKILSNDYYAVGSVWVLDAVHLPYGCSVWPAFWSYGTGTWPEGGEIDTLEGVNNQVANQMALHTEDGCSAANTSSAAYSGILNDTSCYYESNSNSGCGITVSDSKSYGADFASNGGGVFVTELAESGISIWFFERANVPAAVSNASDGIDTRSLGTPAGYWGGSSCGIDKFFTEQRLVFDITLCGSWAGAADILSTTGCPALVGSDTCYTTYVLNASNYDTAYFEINSLKVYSNSSSSTSSDAVSAASVRARAPMGGSSVGLSMALTAVIVGVLALV